MFTQRKYLSKNWKLSKFLNLIPALVLNLLKDFPERSKKSFNKFRTSAYGLKPSKHYYHITLFTLFCVGSTHPLIIESNKLETVIDYISSPKTLVIFDIDNTIARPVEELSSDEWFCHLVEKKMLQGHDYLTSIYYALPVTYYAQFNVSLTPTEFTAPFLIEQLIDHNIHVMALSTRSLFVAERTIEQLEEIAVHFLVPTMSQAAVVLNMPHPCFYTRSILFGGNNDKGEALLCLFQHMNYYPQQVVFIDDKMKYLESVEKALKKYNIPFVGIRYSGCDERVKNFDPTKAEKQWRQLRYKKES